jgi:hypothetical protein
VPIEPKVWSVSQLGAYQRCPKQYELARVIKVEEKPGLAAVAGNAVHTWTERHDRHGLDAVTHPPVGSFLEVFEETIEEKERQSGVPWEDWKVSGTATKQWPHRHDLDYWADKGPVMCDQWTTVLSAAQLQVVTGLPPDKFGNRTGIEYHVEGTVGVLVLDIKTGQTMPTSIQLDTYAVLCQLRGIPAAGGLYWNARKNELTDIKWCRRSAAVLGDTFKQVSTAQALKLYPANVDSHCSWCGVKPHCPMWQ